MPYALFAIIIGLMALDYLGAIDLSDYKPDFLNSNPNFGDETFVCPPHSKYTNNPCCSDLEKGKIRPSVSSIYIRDSCKCPSDTKFLTNAPEVAFIICECLACNG